MEPISVLLAALAFGATEAAKAGVQEIVKDAYNKLKQALARKFGNATDKIFVLEQFQADQDTWEKPLRKALTEAAADRDDRIMAIARTLQALGEQSVGPQIYQTTFGEHAIGNAVGPRASAHTYINKGDSQS
jgi:hypothetical protein